MQESNEPRPSPEPSLAPSGPDFNQSLRQAQSTGDFDFVLETAKRSHKMLMDFRDVVKAAVYSGKDAGVVAMGLNFLENMISSSAGQIESLKQTERETRAAMKAALKAQKDASPALAVIDPEKPAEPTPQPEAPRG